MNLRHTDLAGPVYRFSIFGLPPDLLCSLRPHHSFVRPRFPPFSRRILLLTDRQADLEACQTISTTFVRTLTMRGPSCQLGASLRAIHLGGLHVEAEPVSEQVTQTYVLFVGAVIRRQQSSLRLGSKVAFVIVRGLADHRVVLCIVCSPFKCGSPGCRLRDARGTRPISAAR